MQNYFATLARYHVWATDKILQQIATISEADYRKDCGLFFKSIHGTLNHLLVGDLHWFSRFSGAPALSLALNAEVETDRAALDARLRAAAEPWQDFLADIPSQRFDSLLYYKRADGEAVSSPFTATLGHVFNHGTHHRGQLSAALTSMGYDCPEIDLIYLVREEMAK